MWDKHDLCFPHFGLLAVSPCVKTIFSYVLYIAYTSVGVYTHAGSSVRLLSLGKGQSLI